ncbi:MAG TPA: carbohydrate kinase [Firmicutes bacterium]|jgi:xylulokinase|nr:carbohydrate kinase [Bacillota bacterium]
MGYLLGFDIGSSSIKASLMDSASGRIIASATSPRVELEVSAPKPGWAEQHQDTWWEHVKATTAMIKNNNQVNLQDVEAIGLSYQMHGLVIVDRDHKVLRPAIIWCDSRAVTIGEEAFKALSPEQSLKHLLNSPGNFTASKLKWVQQNEPDIYKKVYKAMLPGDYIAMKMSGEIKTTPSGLSEGILWDFQNGSLAQLLLDYYHISPELIPDRVPTFSHQGRLTKEAAAELGLKPGTQIAYRAGDQPNNAFSLNVLEPGELAATAGTSGVVYGVGDKPNYDPKSRVNTFVHVNHTADAPRYGILLCMNGTGILNRWIKNNVAAGLSYEEINQLAASVPVGCENLSILPYGNGAERTLENRNIGASIHGLNFNIHDRSYLLRAAQEGIVFALNYGLEIMADMGIQIQTVKAGHANMFLSPIFSEAFATLSGAQVELYNTDGSQGAARGAGVGAGVFKNFQEAFTELQTVKTIQPSNNLKTAYQDAYQQWKAILKHQLE